MNPEKSQMDRCSSPHALQASFWASVCTHALVWVLVLVAGLLLVGFTAVVDDATQRGELRRIYQRTSGLLKLPEELQNQDSYVMRLVTLTGHKLVGR